MGKNRLEAFSDGVLAIIITIMVLEMKVPHGARMADLHGLAPLFVCYVLSFIYVGIYWNNHHHLCHAVRRVDGVALWANLHLLFWLSLFPLTTGWMGENHFAPVPTALYGFVLLMAALAYTLLELCLMRRPDENPDLAQAVGRETKGKISIGLYLAGIGMAFVQPWFGLLIYTGVAALWLVPDRRIEKKLRQQDE